MAPVAWCWCSHCGVTRRLRREGEYASCSSCGKVLLQLRDAAAEAPRPRLHLRPRMRTAKRRAVAADAAAGGDKSRREAYDAESNTG
ncbi:hypothetical protein E2562_002172 [Oryza meyeriana var. granulata]|uniref:Uncharacterized protein n=1 Tax=Oryza meyeriana var. granulata TaxID=110450 RepID=A0A6G1ECU5_9ORYZ|nr:hypothetical protein E2562_002172 [Oryza meyeriana var. granulata]